MKYLIKESLIPKLEVINNNTQRFAVPCSTNDGIVIDVLDGWTEHEQFAIEHDLEPVE